MASLVRRGSDDHSSIFVVLEVVDALLVFMHAHGLDALLDIPQSDGSVIVGSNDGLVQSTPQGTVDFDSVASMHGADGHLRFKSGLVGVEVVDEDGRLRAECVILYSH